MATDNGVRSGSSLIAGIATGSRGRDRLARMVVVGSFLTLFLMTGVLITLAQGNNTTASDTAKNAFNAILPVLAGWVGTVLAFYFSSANQEHTNDILDKTIGRVAGAASGSGTLVSEKMIPLSKIYGLRNLNDENKGPAQIPIADLQKDFNVTLPNGAPVTRLLFVEDGIFKFILHNSTLNGFIVKAQNASPPSKPETFQDLLKDQDVVNQIAKLVVFVSAATTLADAKTALDKVPGAQDIIVTPTGNATEPMIGWLSNVDLTKALTVN